MEKVISEMIQENKELRQDIESMKARREQGNGAAEVDKNTNDAAEGAC